MAEDNPFLHVDSDWKKQAAEEKKRLAEQEAQRRAQQQQAAAAPAGVIGGAAASPARSQGRAREREMPEASFTTLVQTLSTQALLYMGELATRGNEPIVNLDLARHNLDLLGILQEKTRGNLTAEEQTLVNNVLYEIRMRYVGIAQQYAQLP